MVAKPDASGGRNLKRMTLDFLGRGSLSECIEGIISIPERQVINPLISFLLHKDPVVRWRSVMAIGEVLGRLALRDMESARVIMRRFMWSLNDESGGIGWGAPESMCVSVANSDGIASEYGSIVVSYLDVNGNYLEYEPLQRGLIWGIVYLARNRRDSVLTAKPFLPHYLDSKDSHVRGLATVAVKLLKVKDSMEKLRQLTLDQGEFMSYEDDSVKTFSIRAVASEALESLE